MKKTLLLPLNTLTVNTWISTSHEWASLWTEWAVRVNKRSERPSGLCTKWAVRANECNERPSGLFIKTRLSRTRNALLLVDWTDKCLPFGSSRGQQASDYVPLVVLPLFARLFCLYFSPLSVIGNDSCLPMAMSLFICRLKMWRDVTRSDVQSCRSISRKVYSCLTNLKCMNIFFWKLKIFIFA